MVRGGSTSAWTTQGRSLPKLFKLLAEDCSARIFGCYNAGILTPGYSAYMYLIHSSSNGHMYNQIFKKENIRHNGECIPYVHVL